jgi:hypothetical protein
MWLRVCKLQILISLLVTEMININFILKATDLSISALSKWILSACLNIHTLSLYSPKKPNGFRDEIARLKKLKELKVWVDKASDLKEVTIIASRIIATLLTSS